MASVRIEKLCKTFDEKTNVVDDVSVCIRDNEFVVIVGPSGCGKTTTLNIIAGLEKPSSGHIFIDDECDQKSSNDDISSASQSDQNIVNSNLYTTGLGSVSKR
jgi:multiple sugar transport system ATP-binding protein